MMPMISEHIPRALHERQHFHESGLNLRMSHSKRDAPPLHCSECYTQAHQEAQRDPSH